VTLLMVGTCTIQASQGGNTDYAAATSVPQSFNITQASQTITFGTLSNQVYGSGTFTVSATASSTLAVSFSSTTGTICGVSGNTVTLLMVGTCTIQASQGGNTDYAAAQNVQQSFNITQASQTITFGTLSNQVYGSGTFTVSATASSTLAVSFASTTGTICGVSGNTVTLLMVGTCTIQASQAGNTDYAAAPNVSQSFNVTQASQTITFGALSDQVYGSAAFTVSATASSTLAVSFVSTTGTICGVSGNTVSLLMVGTCTIQASQAGNTDYAAAPNVSQSFNITQASQTITFGALSDQVYGSGTFTVSATASSTLAVSFVSTTGTICGVSGNTVSLLMAGTCTIQASQAGNTDYAAAANVLQSFNVTQESQTIAFAPLPNIGLGSAPFAIGATASSSLALTFTSTTTSVCTVSGNTVTLVSAGTCTIQASQSGNTNFAAAAAVTQSFTVSAAGPVLGTVALLVGSAAGASSVVLSDGSAWTASSNSSFLHLSSGNASGAGSAVVVFTYDAFAGSGIRTGTLTIAGLTLTVTQVGANYLGPGPLTTLVSSGLNNPTGVAVDSSGNVYIADYSNGAIKEWNFATQQVTALVSSGLNNPVGVAVDAGGNVYFADQGNNAIKEWTASTQQVTALVTGLNGPQGVAVDSSGNVYIADSGNNAVKEWAASTQQVTSLVSSGLSSPAGVAVDAAGNVYIADQGNAAVKEWNAANGVTALVSSGLKAPAGVAVDGSGNLYIADYGSGSGAVYEWSAATGQVATLASSALTHPFGVAVDAGGDVYIADNGANDVQELPNAYVGPAAGLSEPAPAGSDSLPPAAPSSQSLTGVFAPASDQTWLTIGTVAGGVVNFSFAANTTLSSRVAHITILGQQIPVTQSGLASQTISFGSLSDQTFGAAPFAISATASSGLAVTFSSTTPLVCTVAGNMVTIMAAGGCSIAAAQAGNGVYAPAASVPQSFNVAQASQTISFGALSDQPFGTAAFTVSAAATSNLQVSFSSTTGTICGVSGNTVTLLMVGPCTIQASQAGNTNYAAAPNVSQSFNVTQASQTITFGALSDVILGVAPFTVSASASSSLTVAFSSTTTSVCTVSGNTVTILTLGGCSIQASQGGNTNYAAAANVTQSFNVNPPGFSITGQVTLSGSGLSGVTVTLGGSASATVTTDANGNYSFTTLAAGGNYTVVPSLSGDAFNPANAAFNSLSANQTANFTASLAVGNVSAAATPAGSSTPANLNAAPTTLTAPAPFHIPITIALNGGVTVDTLSFGVQITPNSTAPALTGALSFTGGSSIAAAPSVSGGTAGSIGASWTSLGTPLSGTVTLGALSGTIPAGAQVGQSYTVSVTVTTAANTGGTVPVGVIAGPNAALSVALTYLEGDVAPYNSDRAPNFGDGVLDIRDLIQELFAVNDIPGFKPANCSDRFDAMDLSPADTSTTRGGDGALDIRDLILELFRVNNLDEARPVRASRGGSCAASGGAGAAEEPSRLDAAQRPDPASDGGLVLGAPESTGAGEGRIPVYLSASRNLANVALTVGLGDMQSQLHFTALPAPAPALVQESQLGVVAVVWQDGITVRAGSALLLGYVSGPSDALPNLRVFGASGAGLNEARALRLELPANPRQ
jgi:sugar lactone lactonase YvrE/ribosomal protein S11